MSSKLHQRNAPSHENIQSGSNLSFSNTEFFPPNNFLDSLFRNATQCDINKRKNKRRMKIFNETSRPSTWISLQTSSHQLCFSSNETGAFVNFVLGANSFQIFKQRFFFFFLIIFNLLVQLFDVIERDSVKCHNVSLRECFIWMAGYCVWKNKKEVNVTLSCAAL